MTFSVFIAYGGDEAKNVAERLGGYLEKKGISTFVASSKLGKWLIPGEYRFNQRILEKLQKSKIMVLVSTRKTPYRKKVREEVLDTISRGRPIIVLKKQGTKAPFSKILSKTHWIPDIDFNPTSPNDVFPEVAIDILLNMEREAESMEQLARVLPQERK